MEAVEVVRNIRVLLDKHCELRSQAEKIANARDLFIYMAQPECRSLLEKERVRRVAMNKINEWSGIEELRECSAVLQARIEQVLQDMEIQKQQAEAERAIRIAQAIQLYQEFPREQANHDGYKEHDEHDDETIEEDD
jgi:hypothetical protein